MGAPRTYTSILSFMASWLNSKVTLINNVLHVQIKNEIFRFEKFIFVVSMNNIYLNIYLVSRSERKHVMIVRNTCMILVNQKIIQFVVSSTTLDG
jgi:hypothetical protein